MFKEEVIINDDTDGKVEAGAAPYQAEFHNLKSGIYKKVFIENSRYSTILKSKSL